MDTLWQDLRYGLRGLRNHPAFTALAALALALGIGATTTIFSVIQNVLLDPFPYKDADRVIAFQIRNTDRPQQGGRTFFQTPEFLDYKEQATVFEDVIAGTGEDVLYTTREGTELLQGASVSTNQFAFLGVAPVHGRTLGPEDGKPGAPPVFVMAHKTWRKHFNLDPSILNQTFMLNGVATTLVGVMPERFTKLAADVYLPIVLDRADAKLAERYFMFQAKLKPGVTLAQAEAELTLIAQRLSKVYPNNYPPQGKFFVKVVSWVDNVVGQFRRTLYTLGAAVGLLLLIACSNVANMLLARASAREKEMAIRASLGASRSRLVRQLLVESLLLAALGMVAGCLFAFFGIKAVVAWIPEGLIPREARIQMNLPVLLFSLGITTITSAIFGLVPALQTARRDLVEPLKDARKGGSGSGFRQGKLRNAIVVTELALSLVLLAGAGLLMRNFIKLTTVDLGFNPENILVARIPLPKATYQTAQAKQNFFRQLLPRVQNLPGVTAITTASTLPPYGGIRSELDIPGKTRTQEKWESIVQLSSEGHVATMGLRLLAGRFLSETEVNDARQVIVVNQTFVRRYFGREDPLGRRVKLLRFETMNEGKLPDATFEIIGVVSDAKNQGLESEIFPEGFIPYSVTGAFERGIMLRTTQNPTALVNTVRQEIWAVDRNVAITLTDSLTNFLKQYSYAQPRFSLLVLGIFAVVGLVLVTLGVYSVLAYTVSQQIHSIGIRMALGATRRDILNLVFRRGVQVVGLGIVVGVSLTWAATVILRNQLEGVSAQDPYVLSLVVVVVAISGLAACYFPARRATKVDPMVALRHD
ncbi:MAG: ABC transporter permease [Verrucomicrobiota bacterium]